MARAAREPPAAVAATRAEKAVRPASLGQVGLAGRLVWEGLLKPGKRFRQRGQGFQHDGVLTSAVQGEQPPDTWDNVYGAEIAHRGMLSGRDAGA